MNSKYKILLVDDEPDILEFLTYNLKKEGYSIFTANNGKEALAQAKIQNPHLIILDVMMPDMDGVETCREIRAIPELKNIVIAFLTARNEDYSQIAGFDVGADDYINKPIKPRVLISRIKALLRRIEKTENTNENPHGSIFGEMNVFITFFWLGCLTSFDGPHRIYFVDCGYDRKVINGRGRGNGPF